MYEGRHGGSRVAWGGSPGAGKQGTAHHAGVNSSAQEALASARAAKQGEHKAWQRIR